MSSTKDRGFIFCVQDMGKSPWSGLDWFFNVFMSTEPVSNPPGAHTAHCL